MISSFDPSQLPRPVFDENPDLVAFYDEAWRLAAEHILHREGAVASPYMDEGFDPNTVWIWDTCFMVQFCKYAPWMFPGIESFDNFYQPLHNGVSSSLAIHHPDNPPLFAWIEAEYARFTGDVSRLERVLPLLVKHFEFMENAKRGQKVAGGTCPLAAERVPLGYHWNGVSSGMDNTPRGRERYEEILWFDLLAQQALSALHIAGMARRLGQTELAARFDQTHAALKTLANTHYWDEAEGMYYDIAVEAPHGRVKVKTPAAYWGLLAGFCDASQAEKLAAHAADPQEFGGDIPWPSVSREDEDFHEDGFYWQGGIWLPLAHMATTALRRAGYVDLADAQAAKLLDHMYRTWREFEPHTIWEAYNPTEAKPSSDKAEFAGHLVRPDFCGWSALGPISLFLESVIGLHEVDAEAGRVVWNPRSAHRVGIRGLRFGGVNTTLLLEQGKLTVESSHAYELIMNGKCIEVQAGTTSVR